MNKNHTLLGLSAVLAIVGSMAQPLAAQDSSTNNQIPHGLVRPVGALSFLPDADNPLWDAASLTADLWGTQPLINSYLQPVIKQQLIQYARLHTGLSDVMSESFCELLSSTITTYIIKHKCAGRPATEFTKQVMTRKLIAECVFKPLLILGAQQLISPQTRHYSKMMKVMPIICGLSSSLIIDYLMPTEEPTKNSDPS